MYACFKYSIWSFNVKNSHVSYTTFFFVVLLCCGFASEYWHNVKAFQSDEILVRCIGCILELSHNSGVFIHIIFHAGKIILMFSKLVFDTSQRELSMTYTMCGAVASSGHYFKHIIFQQLQNTIYWYFRGAQKLKTLTIL